MLGTISADFSHWTAMYRVKQRVHVVMSNMRLCNLRCCIAWNWLKAPTKLSWREGDGLPCSASRNARGAGRNSSFSTYSKFQTFSTSFIGSVGKPFATRYLHDFASVFPLHSAVPSNDASKGIMRRMGVILPLPLPAAVEFPPPLSAVPDYQLATSSGGKAPSCREA